MAEEPQRSRIELQGDVDSLRSENEALRFEIDSLRLQNTTLAKQVEVLTTKIAELEKRLGRNSSNSSLSPSSDLFGRNSTPESPNRKARRALGKKQGKQPGTEGKHLAQRVDPDEVINHIPTACSNCKADLIDAPIESIESRQVFDVPKPLLSCIEHRSERRRCSCGTITAGSFPSEARSWACYGPRIRAVALYLLNRQHIPTERTSEAIADLFGAEVSTGFLDSLYSEGTELLAPFLSEVLEQLKRSDVVCMDETSDRLSKKKVWFHVASNELLTLISANLSRGKSAIEKLGLLPDFSGTAVHDRFGIYFDYQNATHAVCGAHLIRNLASVAEVQRQSAWATGMCELLLEMKDAAQQSRDLCQSQIPDEILGSFLSRYDSLVAMAFLANPDPAKGAKRNSLQRESYNLAVAFSKHKESICRFGSDLKVPFTNNQAERDFRMVKLHRKISGSFRSIEGAERLAAVRSYISTAKKQGRGALEVLTMLFEGNPWMPTQLQAGP